MGLVFLKMYTRVVVGLLFLKCIQGLLWDYYFLNVYKGCYGISIKKMYTRVFMGLIF
jgi:hypothetical protein